MAITLRTLTDSDLDALFDWESDPRAVQMAAFTRANPSDRSEFDAHYERVRNDPSNTLRAIDDDNEFVGTVASFTMEGKREVSYWIAPARWGQGVASRVKGVKTPIPASNRGLAPFYALATSLVTARARFACSVRLTAYVSPLMSHLLLG